MIERHYFESTSLTMKFTQTIIMIPVKIFPTTTIRLIARSWLLAKFVIEDKRKLNATLLSFQLFKYCLYLPIFQAEFHWVVVFFSHTQTPKTGDNKLKFFEFIVASYVFEVSELKLLSLTFDQWNNLSMLKSLCQLPIYATLRILYTISYDIVYTYIRNLTRIAIDLNSQL